MKRFYFIFLFFTFLANAQDCPFCASLELRVEGLRNDSGVLRVMLTTDETSFHESDPKRLNLQKIFIRNEKIKNGKAKVLFPKLQSGEYAYRIFHDENNNELLDSTLMGRPLEGVAVSGYEKIGRESVQFSKAKFRVLSRKKYKFPVQIRYLGDQGLTR